MSRSFVVILGVLLLGACGQSGPLRHPDPAPTATPAAATTTPAAGATTQTPVSQPAPVKR